jgi:hypothetical protein
MADSIRSKKHNMLSHLTRREILKKINSYLLAFILMPLFLIKKAAAGKAAGTTERMKHCMNLPKPRLKGEVSVEQAIKHRRTIRSYQPKPLTLEQFSQIFWAAQGITEDRGYKRSAPSAGANSAPIAISTCSWSSNPVRRPGISRSLTSYVTGTLSDRLKADPAKA